MVLVYFGMYSTSTHDEVSGAAGSERVDQWLLLQVIVDEGAR